jgi:2,3-bisphosphoglycerate-independent phosphoglycerate mutase
LKAIELLKQDEYEFGFLHVKAIDDAGHDKNLKVKIEQLEKVDAMLRIIVD